LEVHPESVTGTKPEALTRPGATPGTLAYMSPEQLLGKSVDARTDLFSLGIVLYEMSTGKPPFDGDSAAALSEQILNHTPPAPERLNSRLSDELGRIAMKCLEKDRELRYQSARELLADLKRVQRDRGSGANAGVDARIGGSRRPQWRRLAWAAGIVVAAGFGWLWQRERSASRPAARIVPFTTDGGMKLTPRLSPDGESVAYAWAGAKDDNWDIYAKAIGPDTAPLRLTQDPASDWSPVWSSDGRQIAFLRDHGPAGWTVETGSDFIRSYSIYTLPARGGQERRLVDFVGPDKPPPATLSWSPDGAWLAVAETPAAGARSRLVRVDLATQEKTLLTSPPEESRGDSEPEVSPDGRQIAFVRASSKTFGDLDIWIQPLPSGTARQLTFGHYVWCCDLAWTERGDEIVFATGNRVLPGSMLRVPAAGGTPTALAGVGDSVSFPTTSTGRMVFSQHVRRTPIEIWRTPGRKAPPASRVPHRLVSSSRNDAGPAYSPDGRRIAFESDRSGSTNIWMADADGGRATQLTTFAEYAGSPHWSPDSRTIVFDAREAGNPDIHVVDVAGGVARRLTHEPSEDIVPCFSRDGRSVYFSSDRGARREIWRMPAEGGAAVQMTREGGYYGEESWDGKFLYYTRGRADPLIWQMPVGGGPAAEVLRGPQTYSWWTVSRDGIYFATRRRILAHRTGESIVYYYDFASRRTSPVFTQAGPFWPATLTVSPDEAWIARHQHTMPLTELMLVENFR
jgi:Tol biopolymer transport system component